LLLKRQAESPMAEEVARVESRSIVPKHPARNAAREAHEHLENAEHAGHAGRREADVLGFSITIAVLAVLAASGGNLETVEEGGAIIASSEAVLAQDKATDAWSEYQADSLKKHIYDIAARSAGAESAEYRASAEKEIAKQLEIRKRAQKDEAERDRLMAESRIHERRHHWLTNAATLIEIAIAICTVAIMTHRRAFWAGAVALGAAGALVMAASYLAAG
jgi:hypothetical protein